MEEQLKVVAKVDRGETFIHPQAVVSEKAHIGAGVHIGPFVFIEDDVVIGEGTWIAPNVTIYNGARIGAHCQVYSGSVISAQPQDLKFTGESTTVEIGDHTVVRECVTINRATKDRYVTKVGSHCLLMAYVHVAHDCWVGDHVIMANCVNLAGHVTIEDWAILEGLVAVQQFVTIGAHTFVTGASLVRKNIPPYIKAGREPLAYLGVNSVGLKRRGFDNDVIRGIEDVYRIIYVRNHHMGKALTQAENDVPFSEEKLRILDFIRDAEKGIIRGKR